MQTLLSLTLSGSALALLLLALGKLLGRRLPSTVYYYAWLLVLLRFLLPLPGLIPLGAAEPSAAPAVRPVEIDGLLPEDGGQAPAPAAVPGPAQPAEGAPAPSPLREAEEALPASAPASSAAPAKHGFSVNWRSPRLWLSVWALGAAACFLWPLLSYLRFTAALRRRLREPGEELLAAYAAFPGRKPELCLSPALRTPLMFGVFAPKIVLPEALSDAPELPSILRHELCHYRRRDPLYKWFAAAVLALHWFNPLSWLIRRELNRSCELSCDEMLLRSMDRREKQAYGETLLRMAASSALPAGVVATTFSTEKRNLKQRLEQIMHYKKSKGRALAALLALLLLCGCGAAAGPAGGRDASLVPAREGAVEVSTVDELLAAIRPNATIVLAPGSYDLSTASDYGRDSANPNYAWVRTPGGTPEEESYELQILGVEGLTLLGSGEGETTIAAVPRYANVLRFVRCADVRVEALTAGHSPAPGYCSGGVLRFEACGDVTVDACGLYGCGTIAVEAAECTDLTVTGSHLYECSYGALFLSDCRKVRVENCDVERNGTKIDNSTAVNLFQVSNCQDVTVTGCRVHDNASQKLLSSFCSKNVLFLSNTVERSQFLMCLFDLTQYPVTVDGCAFSGNEMEIWTNDTGVAPVDAAGRSLDPLALQNMEYREIDPASVQPALPAVQALEVPAGGSVTVKTADEFLSAIGPDRTILLDGDSFDLSAAENYGGAGTEYYYWAERPDGPELIITDVSGLSIQALSEDPAATTLLAAPRYANVLRFRGCQRISLSGFTAGHSEQPGSCSGGVLYFSDCHEISLDSCRLYGCGTLGVDCENCTGFSARNCEIYDCSLGGVNMLYTDGIRFQNCDIHDVPSPALRFRNCGDKSWNGQPVTGEEFDVKTDGSTTELVSTNPLTSHARPAFSPLQLLPAGSFSEQDGTLAFAREVQAAIAGGDWKALSEKLVFPFQIYTAEGNYAADNAVDFLRLDLDAVLSPAFRQQIGAMPLDGYVATALGNSFCEGRLVFASEYDGTEAHYYLLAISVDDPVPEDREPEALEIFYYETLLTDFTLREGEELRVEAVLFPLGLFPDAEIRWACDAEGVLKLTPDSGGRYCTVEVLKVVPGGVKLTVSFRDLSRTLTVTTKSAGQSPAPTPAP